MSRKQIELDLFNETLDWVKSKTSPRLEPHIEYFETYSKFAGTHKSLIDEEFGEHNTRHGAKSVRGTTGEMLSVVALSLPRFANYEIERITDKTEQKYGTDYKLWYESKAYAQSKSKKPIGVSCKTGFGIRSEGLDTILRLHRDWFEPAVWRVDFLSVVHPETKRVWMLNYGVVASIYCTLRNGIPTPTFEDVSIPFSIMEYKQKFADGLIYFNLNKEEEWIVQ